MAYYIGSLGLIPYFTSRAFIPLFAAAFLARVGPEWSWVATASGFEMLISVPSWATGNLTLSVLGVMALVELIGTKSPDFRELLSLSNSQLKGIAAFFACFASVGGNPWELVELFSEVGFSTEFAWGQSVAYTWSFGIGAAVWLTSTLRNSIYIFLIEIDDDDDLGLQKLLSWLEDGLSFIGVWFVVIAPVIALALAGSTILLLYLLKRYFERRDDKSKVSCESCGSPNAPCGLRCGSCGVERRLVQEVGLLGNLKNSFIDDRQAHQIDLLARKRCSSCGERLKGRTVDQICHNCGKSAFSDRRAFEEYLAEIGERLPVTLIILLVLGLIPLVGLIPGIIFYRLSLISSLKHYLPRGHGFFIRWLVRIVNVVLLCLQPVPLLGGLTLPLMCLTNYMVYQAALRRQSQRRFAGAPQPA